jgi:hypothetical protein
VAVEIQRDGGAFETIAASTPAAAGEYSWTVSGAGSSDCVIRVTDAADASVLDDSDESFAIVAGLETGLSVWWKFDDEVGSATAADSSGNSNDGTVEGVAFVPDGGTIGGAASLAGNADSYVIKNPVSSFATFAITTAFWVKTTDANCGLVSYASTGSDNAWLVMDDGTLYVWSEPASPARSAICIADGRWHHVAATWDAAEDTLRLYLDGVALPVIDLIRGPLAGDGSLVVGQDQDSVGGGFEPGQALAGCMDDVRIYSRVLSATEIRALASMGD